MSNFRARLASGSFGLLVGLAFAFPVFASSRYRSARLYESGIALEQR